MSQSSVIRRLLAEPDAAVDILGGEGLLDHEGLDLLLAEIARHATSDSTEAFALLDVVPPAAQAAGVPGALPDATYLRARLTLDAGEPVAALGLIESARADYARLGMTMPGLRTALGRMHVLDDLGRHAEAVDAGRELLGALEDLPSEPEVLRLRASVQGNLGVALGFTGRHADAFAAYRSSESTWREIGRLDEAAAAVANQGVELTAMGQPGAALDRFDAAAAVFDATGDRAWYAKCLGHRGEALTAAGWPADALVDYQTARRILDGLGARTEAWRVGLGTASTFLGLGLTDEALTVLDPIEQELREAGLRHDLAAALCTKGMAQARSGQADRARVALTEAAELYGTVEDVPNQARALLELSACVGDEQARPLVRRAAALLAGGNWPGIRCLAALRLATLHADDVRTAESLLVEAAALADDLALPHLRHAVSLRLGTLRLRLGDLDRGIDHLTLALAEVEQIGSRIRDDGLRTAYLASRNAAQDDLIAALLRRGSAEDLTRAAALSDRAKGRTLVDVLRGAARRQEADGEAEPLTGELQAAYSALFAADSGTQPALRARVGELERRISASQAMAAAPRSSAERTPADAHALPGVATLAYHVVGEEIVAFVTVGGSTRVRRHVTDRARLLGLLDDLDTHLGAHAVAVLERYGEARAAACRRVLQELYLAVFAPIVDLLPQRRDEPHPLLVVPHGPVHRVPFNALHDGLTYLLDHWVISVSPSLEAARLASVRPARGGRALAVGVADDATPLVEEEARTIGAVIGDATVLIGADGTVNRVRAGAENAALVHLACHGLFRPENVAFTSFRLADRWVRAADVAAFDLDGAVLVLSACESGRVGPSAGDEAAGLARAFLLAGARCVVVSQWLAEDRCTAELMLALHRRLAAGADPATALRAAQRAVIDTYPHPFHWAPFIAVGAPSIPKESHDASR